MIVEVATAQADTLDDWARQWSAEGREGASEVAFLLQRAARQIRATMGVPSRANGEPGAESLHAGSRLEPGDGKAAGDQPENRAELRDG